MHFVFFVQINLPATAFSAFALSRRIYIAVARKKTPPMTSTNVVENSAYCKDRKRASLETTVVSAYPNTRFIASEIYVDCYNL